MKGPLPHVKPQRPTDGLSFHNTLASKFLPFMVTAMTLLAAFALSGAYGAHMLAKRWSKGAASVVIIQIPPLAAPVPQAVTDKKTPPEKAPSNYGSEKSSAQQTSPTQLAMNILQHHPEDFQSIHLLTPEELHNLIAPWLGKTSSVQQKNQENTVASSPFTAQDSSSQPSTPFAIPVPDIIEIHLAPNHGFPPEMAQQITTAIKGSRIEYSTEWSNRLHLLAISLQICAGAALLLVLAISCAVIAITTRTGLIARKRAIHLIHSLGATDGYIAARFSFRIAMLTFIGGTIGTILVLPLIIFLAQIIAPFTSSAEPEQFLSFSSSPQEWLSPLLSLSSTLILSLLFLPIVAAMIGWCTTQVTVRTWLKRLP